MSLECSKQRFYDWDKTMSYHDGESKRALLTMVVGGNGIGKTYGLRKWLVNRFLKTGETFCEICRHSSEIPTISAGWFGKLEANNEFSDKLFKTEAGIAYVADRFDSDGNELDKVPADGWNICGYFVALSQFENVKRSTFVNVGTCVFDEFILDRSKPNCRYMRNEFSLLMKICVAVFREIPGDGKDRRIVMMANAVDMVNPYFLEYGISEPPRYGFTWFNDKHVLLHYVKPWDAEERKSETVVGLLTSGRVEQQQMFDNVMFGSSSDFVRKKPSDARFCYAIVYNARRFGVWRDQKGRMYITDKIPKDGLTYAISTLDNGVDVVMAKRTSPMLKALCELYYLGMVYYENPALRGGLEQVLSYMGIR